MPAQPETRACICPLAGDLDGRHERHDLPLPKGGVEEARVPGGCGRGLPPLRRAPDGQEAGGGWDPHDAHRGFGGLCNDGSGKQGGWVVEEHDDGRPARRFAIIPATLLCSYISLSAAFNPDASPRPSHRSWLAHTPSWPTGASSAPAVSTWWRWRPASTRYRLWSWSACTSSRHCSRTIQTWCTMVGSHHIWCQ